MNNSLIFKVEAETMDYLQLLFYEQLSYKTILSDILLVKRKYTHNIETYEKFMQEYKDVSMKFEITKEQVIREYAGDNYWATDYEYDFNFAERTIKINTNKVSTNIKACAGGSCKCN